MQLPELSKRNVGIALLVALVIVLVIVLIAWARGAFYKDGLTIAQRKETSDQVSKAAKLLNKAANHSKLIICDASQRDFDNLERAIKEEINKLSDDAHKKICAENKDHLKLVVHNLTRAPDAGPPPKKEGYVSAATYSVTGGRAKRDHSRDMNVGWGNLGTEGMEDIPDHLQSGMPELNHKPDYAHSSGKSVSEQEEMREKMRQLAELLDEANAEMRKGACKNGRVDGDAMYLMVKEFYDKFCKQKSGKVFAENYLDGQGNLDPSMVDHPLGKKESHTNTEALIRGAAQADNDTPPGASKIGMSNSLADLELLAQSSGAHLEEDDYLDGYYQKRSGWEHPQWIDAIGEDYLR